MRRAEGFRRDFLLGNCVYGLSRVLRGVPSVALVAVGAIAIKISISEVLATGVAFTSAYNWFHM